MCSNPCCLGTTKTKHAYPAKIVEMLGLRFRVLLAAVPIANLKH